MKKIKLVDKVFPSETSEESYKFGIKYTFNKKPLILSKTSFYIPNHSDFVIGKVVYVVSDYYKLKINDCFTGILPILSFYNVTKKNRPRLEVGDYVYCKIVNPPSKNKSDNLTYKNINNIKGTELLLTCETEDLGKLKFDETDVFSTIFELDCYKVNLLFYRNVLSELGKKYKFVIVIGFNGLIFLKSDSLETLGDLVAEIRKIN